MFPYVYQGFLIMDDRPSDLQRILLPVAYPLTVLYFSARFCSLLFRVPLHLPTV